MKMEEHDKKRLYGICDGTYCHRDVFFDLEVLEIKECQRVEQSPGELIIVGSFVAHNVLNEGKNCAESMNYLDDWKTIAAFKVCTHSEMLEGRPNWEVVHEELEERIKNGEIVLGDCVHFSDDTRDEKLICALEYKEAGEFEMAKATVEAIKLKALKQPWMKRTPTEEEKNPAKKDEYKAHQNFSCDLCDYVSHHSGNFQTHMMKKHNLPKPPAIKSKCPKCGIFRVQLEQHMKRSECKRKRAEDQSAEEPTKKQRTT